MIRELNVLTQSEIAEMSSGDLTKLALSTKGDMEIFPEAAEQTLYVAVKEYGLENLPSDFLRVFYTHFSKHVKF